jgi:two-component system, cell cycle sensor histidine kinase and response regulator CckA
MEIIGTLAAGVAHDFNNLLQAIRGNNGLVLREIPPDSKLRRFAEQVQLASGRAADVTKQLLSFSRSTEERKTVVDLNLTIQEAGQLARRTLRGNVALEINPAPAPLRVKVDSTRASQALLNLCVNAQDAMLKGGKLTLTNTRLELPYETAFQHCLREGAEYACCSISDTGSGIPPELLRRIFEPFFTTKEAGKGTGLGLPIVQRVMKEAGGFIEVDSLVGVGTTFHLYFPVATEELTVEAEGGTQILARGTGRVLVVDDLDLVRDFTRNFLESTGLTVFIAADARQAIQMLEKLDGQVDLLFTDYNMPGISGIELIEQVGTRWPGIGCVLATGYLDDHAKTRVTELRATVLNKPYDMRKASTTIMQLLGKRKAP